MAGMQAIPPIMEPCPCPRNMTTGSLKEIIRGPKCPLEKKGSTGGHGAGVHGAHGTYTVEDFKRRFLVSFAITVPILLSRPCSRCSLALA